MKPCPAETTLSDLLAGLLPAEERSQVLTHVESCHDCQRVLAAADSTSSDTPTEPAAAPLERGARLSRYVVLERIGAGAMGVVYAAYDPELDRQVALKMLRPEGRQVEELRQRLVLEAQSLARLSHANVVSVFDVGTHDDCVFLAMELVDGVTLAEWLRTPRSWQEVLRVFTEAGRGLSAAHSAGLVHRDFKPANVLVHKDGRARVTDFGMARPLNRGQATASKAEPGAASSTASPLTRTGVLLGTPAYMAPELLDGRRADALSDQFSFCVALHEALYGVRPFEGVSLEEVARAAQEERLRPVPHGTKVPAWVRRAVLRGLKPRPEERHPSMEPLLAALAPPPRRVWALMTALAGLACLLGGVGAWTLAHRTEARCEQEVEKLDAAWSPVQREQVHAAFLASGVSHAADTWEKVAGILDGHASQWRTLRTEACVTSHEQPASNAWQTAACLDTRLWQLAAVTDVLRKADAAMVRKSVQLVTSLEGLTGCRDAPELSTRPQPPDALRARVDAARRKLAEAEAQNAAGRYAEGLKLTSALLEDIQDVDYKPLEAEVLLSHGRLLDNNSRPKDAEPIFYKAVFAAEAGHDDATAARTWNHLLLLVGSRLARPADAERIAQHAQAAVVRLGRERFPAVAADFYLALSYVLMQQGKYGQADVELSKGLELAKRAHGEDSLRAADFLVSLGRVHYEQDRYQQALDAHLRALQIRERLLGPNHPVLAHILNELAIEYDDLGRTDEAIAALRRAVGLFSDVEGQEPSILGVVLGTLGGKLQELGHAEEGRRHYERARAIFVRILGPDNPLVALTDLHLGILDSEADQPEKAFALFADAEKRIERALGPDSRRSTGLLITRADAYNRVGRNAEARKDLMHAKAIIVKEHGPDTPNVAEVAPSWGRVALDERKPREALDVCEHALALDEKTQGPRSQNVARNLVCLGEAHLDLGEPEKARPLLERALEVLNGASTAQLTSAWARFLMARALMAQHPPDKERARAFAEQARAVFEAQGNRARPEMEKLRAWQLGLSRR
ncbi:serine/threonine protein kinase [Pyxidicoccus parkwayensis]|uniref:Serine/threonine protein kinase n=1 Tax=Pyxidicoccus parkwayensis TaxID=2813578 RepID=A0ABX7NJF6_9BACT|nr:serine/threonine-protein kinase [Pyxidicoccus parkwaysis]QSQ18987.1 serine/threonine protein kinase [Pyxidicoccus parkwaysis]